MIILEFLKSYGVVISMLVSFMSFFIVLWLGSKFAKKATEEEVSDLKVQTAQEILTLIHRVSHVEESLKSLPSKSEIHELKMQICDLTGELKRVDEKFDGTDGLIHRLEKQVGRIDQFLRSKTT